MELNVDKTIEFTLTIKVSNYEINTLREQLSRAQELLPQPDSMVEEIITALTGWNTI